MRHRERSTEQTTRVGNQDFNPNGGLDWTYDEIPVGWSGTREAVDDTSTPGYAARRKNGEIIINDFVRYKCSREVSKDDLRLGPHPSWGSRRFYGSFADAYAGSTNDPLPLFATDLEREGLIQLTKCYAKMNSSTLMVGELFSDLEKTVSMLRRPFQGVQDLIRRMAKYKSKHLGKSAASALKATKNSWLEYRYGWNPLIGDAISIMEEADKEASAPKVVRKVVRAGKKLERMYNTSLSSSTTIGRCSWSTVDLSCKHDGSAHAGIIYEAVGTAAFGDVPKFGGTRARDFGPTLWEIVPYSFVVDWFINVGDWIQAITPDPSVRVRGSWITTIHNRTIRYSNGMIFLDIMTPPRTLYSGSFGPHTEKTVWVKRTASPILPRSPLLLRKTLSGLRCADGLALMIGKILSDLKGFHH